MKVKLSLSFSIERSKANEPEPRESGVDALIERSDRQPIGFSIDPTSTDPYDRK